MVTPVVGLGEVRFWQESGVSRHGDVFTFNLIYKEML
jgi:hypothetical protein